MILWLTNRIAQGNDSTSFTVLCVSVCIVVLVAFGILLYKIHKHK